MAPTSPPPNDIPDDDELDAILNGTLDGQDIFDLSNLEPQPQTQAQSQPAGRGGEDTDLGLGLDTEIKVQKKRAPIPKLDDNLLLSPAGIPKLRRIAKERVKFKGKGHEYTDISRLLNTYQLWLDDLYPRAKFADGLAMIEKLGHTKRVQMMRKEWIDEGKPKHTSREEDEELEVVGADEVPRGGDREDAMEGVEDGVAQSVEQEQDSSLGEQNTAVSAATDALARTQMGEEPDEDELDALLAGDDATTAPRPAPAPAPAKPPTSDAAADEDDPFADAMEAMAEMEGMW